MSYNLTYMGHASFIFETDETALLMDPWYSEEGAFLGAWRQLPPITNQLQLIKEKSKQKEIFCYVSHNHQDHFDKKTLLELDQYISKYIIVNYENKYFFKMMKEIGNEKVIELDELNFHSLNDVEVFLFREESGINRDSAIFCKSNGHSFFNYNDCKMFDQVNIFKNKIGSVDVITGQFSGAVMHPHSYKYADNEIIRIANQKKRSKFMLLAKFIREVKPKVYIPSAGPPLLLGEGLEKLNYEKENTIFPKNDEFYAWWKSKGVLSEIPFHEILPLENISSNVLCNINIDHCSSIDESKISSYIEHYKNINFDYKILSDEKITKFLRDEFSKKINFLKSLDKDLLPFGDFSFVIENEFGVTINFEKLTISDWSRENKKSLYTHYVTRSHISKLIETDDTWEVYFLSMDFLNERAPDEYNTSLMIFLLSDNLDIMKFAFDKLKAFRQSTDSIELESKHGDRVVCARYCPHAGADLKHAIFDGRYVICPRHGWKFDTKNGGLEVNNNSKLEIYELEN